MGTMYDPYAFWSEGKFQMVVSDRGRGCLILIDSTDGENWSNSRDLLKGLPSSWEEKVNRGCLLNCAGTWYLWYTGQSKGVSCIGLAKSQDGLNFSRVQEAPVLKAELPCEGLSAMNPCVLWDESSGIFKMWYSAGENYEPDVICYAESPDGINWKKCEKPVLTKYADHPWERYKVGGCQVLKENSGYCMYYIGYQNVDVARICVAKSSDGINWDRDPSNLLLSPSPKSWDADATYKPTVVNCGKKSYLWYNGRKMHEEYIGFALKGE